jgi:hypothetical protein
MSQGALGAVKMAVSWSFRAGLRERERERERERAEEGERKEQISRDVQKKC